MIKDYSLFYSYKNIGDVLLIVIDKDAKQTHTETKGNVVVIYNNDAIIGYNILNLSKTLKIRTDGIIFAPSRILINVINIILKNNGCEELEYSEQNNYTIGQIKDVIELEDGYLYKIDIKDEIVTAFYPTKSLAINDKTVVAIDGDKLNTGDKFHAFKRDNILINALILSEKDLNISLDDQAINLDIDVEIGDKFFDSEDIDEDGRI